MFSLQAGTWTSPTVSGTSPTRYTHTAVISSDGKMWIFGGRDGTHSASNDARYLDTQAELVTTDFVEMEQTSANRVQVSAIGTNLFRLSARKFKEW